MVFHLAGHTFGHLGWRASNDPAQQEVIHYMTTYKFPFMGAVHSIGDYYEGYGWISAIAMSFFVFMLWILSSACETSTALVRKILFTFFICLLIWAAIEFLFFFPFAASITFAAAVCCIVAWFSTGNVDRKV